MGDYGRGCAGRCWFWNRRRWRNVHVPRLFGWIKHAFFVRVLISGVGPMVPAGHHVLFYFHRAEAPR